MRGSTPFPRFQIANGSNDHQGTSMPDLKRTAEQYLALFEAAPNGVMAVAATGSILLLNRQIEKMFGYAGEDLIGQSVDILVPLRFRRGHAQLRKHMNGTPQMRPMGTNRDLLGLRKDGSEFPIEVGLNPVAMSSGSAVIATVVDITERKRAEAGRMLLEYERAPMDMCEQLGMPAAVLRLDGQVLFLNALMTRLRSQFVLKGDRIQLSNTAENELFLRAMASLNTEENHKFVHSIPIQAADDYPPLAFHVLPIKGPIGSTVAVLVVTLGASEVPSAELVQRLFALTPAEARVAALIGSGSSPRQAARNLGVSEGTVRTTLKFVFAKIGVSRQNELAALVTKFALR
jgi:PAS domain S-box-containing protein